MANEKKQTLLTIYLWLISLVSFIGLCISFIIFANTLVSKKLITDQEYLVRNSREMDRCSETIRVWDFAKERTDPEKEECEEKTKEKMLLQRSVNSKETMISSLIRFFILLFVFPIHFTYFRKNVKQ